MSSGGIVENDAERVPLAAAHDAHAVAHGDAVGHLGAAHRPMTDGEDDAIAAPQRHHGGARLYARPLLGQHEFTAREVPARFREQDRDLQREDVLAVEVLVQAVEVARPVAQEERCRARLAGRKKPA
jgi:hypothetical protein